MRIVITGAAGRLGSTVVKHLAAPATGKRHDVVATDRTDKPLNLPDHARYEQADLRDAGAMQRIIRAAEAVIHLGAIPARNPHLPATETYDVNVCGTHNVLHAAARTGAKLVIVASSICAIGLPDSQSDHGLEYLPLDEDHPCRPRYTYDLTKLINEVTCETFSRLTGITTVCFRFPFLTTIAPDNEALRKRLAERPPSLPLADYLDFRDAAHAIEAALPRTDLRHEVFFLHADTIGTLAPTPEHLAHFAPAIPWQGSPPTDTTPLIDASKAKRILGFSPRYTWQEMMRESPTS